MTMICYTSSNSWEKRISYAFHSRVSVKDTQLSTICKQYYIIINLHRSQDKLFFFPPKNRPILSIDYNSSMTSASWMDIFKGKNPLSIKVFDAGSCYWLPIVGVLRPSIVKMTDLRELYIHDTQFSLGHLPVVFAACQKIVKLSLTIRERNLHAFEKKNQTIRQGFERLTHLKISVFPSDERHSIESWLAILGVLSYVLLIQKFVCLYANDLTSIFPRRWCRSCKHLLINVPHTVATKTPMEFPDNSKLYSTYKNVSSIIRNQLLPRLGWMRSLETFVINRGRGDTFFLTDHYILRDLLEWLFRDENNSPWHSLGHLWIEDCSRFPTPTEREINGGSSMTSLLVPKPLNTQLVEANEARFKDLEHLGGIEDELVFQSFDYLKKLKYIRGTCNDGQVIGI